MLVLDSSLYIHSPEAYCFPFIVQNRQVNRPLAVVFALCSREVMPQSSLVLCRWFSVSHNFFAFFFLKCIVSVFTVTLDRHKGRWNKGSGRYVVCMYIGTKITLVWTGVVISQSYPTVLLSYLMVAILCRFYHDRAVMCSVTGSFSALVTSQVFVQSKANTVCIIVLIIKG